MAELIVENGTGVEDANCCISLAAADAHHLARGKVAWAAADEEARKTALINAFDYMEFAYSWADGPRVFRAGGVPAAVAKANAELALLALSGELMPAQSGPALASESVSVGGAVTRSRTFANGGGFTNQRRFPFVDKMLERFASDGSSGVRYQRIERA